MIDVKAKVTIPALPEEAFAEATDLEHADWLPAIRGIRHVGGPQRGVGARYAVEAGFVGRHLAGVLVCERYDAPTVATFALRDGMDLEITLETQPVTGGCTLELVAHYAVRGGALSGAMEKASAGPARREVARALEQFAARFGRKAEMS